MTGIVPLPFGSYQPGNSQLHRVDPRVKLSTGVLFIFATMMAQAWGSLGPLMVLCGLVLLASGSEPAQVWRDIFGLWLFYVVTFLFHLIFTREGEPIWRGLGLVVTDRGFDRGLLFSTKIALLTLPSAAVQRSAHPHQWSEAVNRLLRPISRINRPISRFAFIFSLAVRMFPTMFEEAERIRQSQIARGLDLAKGGIIQKVRNLIALAAPLLTAVLRRSDQLTDAMVSRGFVLDAPRTPFDEPRIRIIDIAGTVVVILLSGGSLLLEFLRRA